jgi:hypothetical protein
MATILDCTAVDKALAALQSPTRNRYYYGKLLDQHHLELEQRYGMLQRWLLNRLSLGSGVLCGLRVTASANGALSVSPGVAVDGLGREIIVPRQSRAVDPRQPTDSCGRPTGTPIRGGGRVTLYICYHECEEEPAPVVVSECEPEDACENGIIRERYLLRIAEGEPLHEHLTGEQCAQIFGQLPAGTSRYDVVCETLNRECTPPAEVCVPLACIELNADGAVENIEECECRAVLLSNAALLDLILCLAARVDVCCGQVAVRGIAIESGNQQAGTVNTILPQPLIARVSEAGQPVDDVTVTFEIQSGGGRLGDDPNALVTSFDTQTDTNGLATLPHWRVGPNVGSQQVRARISSGMPDHIVFSARVAGAAVELPVVTRIWPPNALPLSLRRGTPEVSEWTNNWLTSPRIEITFNHKMRQAALQEADAWLRVFQLRRFGPDEIQVEPLGIAHIPIASPMLGPGDFTEGYAVRFQHDALSDEAGVRLLVVMRAEPNNIMDTSTPPLLLDAEFKGTTLTDNTIDEIWKLQGQQFFNQGVWDALIDTGALLPSGNDVEGGVFTGWFQVSRD